MPTNFNVATSGFNLASLNVRADQLPINDPITPSGAGGATVLGSFRTDVGSSVWQTWRMMRSNNQIGLLYGRGDHRAFHIQAPSIGDVGQDQYSGIFLMNDDQDGFWIAHDGGPLGGRTFPNPAIQVIDRVGYAALGEYNSYLFTGMTLMPRGPWSRLHLFHDNIGNRPWYAFRPQMRNGITLTGNSDLAYIGQWYDSSVQGGSINETDDNSNLVLGISDDDLPVGTSHKWDNISFRFFDDLNGTDPENTTDGLELMRVTPYRDAANDPVTGRVGIGDFVTLGSGPTESLDILTGNLKIRDLPGTSANNSLTKIMAVDNTGLVQYVDASALTGQSDCDWSQNVASPNHVFTATGSANAACPDENENVGIGTSTPTLAKLEVIEDTPSGTNRGIYVKTTGGGTTNFGLQSICVGQSATHNYGITTSATDGSTETFGIKTTATTNANGVNGTKNMAVRAEANVSGSASINNNHGVWSQAYVTGTVANNYGGYFFSKGVAGNTSITNRSYGVYGVAQNSDVENIGVYGLANKTTAGVNYGVYGSAAAGGGTGWAGFFNGDGRVVGTLTVNAFVNLSDAMFKTNVNDLTGGLSIVKDLQPRTYDFNSAAFPSMNLTSGNQIGLVAQEVEAVLPAVVHDLVHPAQYDSLGNQTAASIDYKGVDYIALVPVLIAAIKEQQAQMDQMQAQLDGCCASGGLDNRNGESRNTGGVNSGNAVATDLLISPNPFSTNTTLRFNLSEEKDARVVATDQRGKEIATLFQSRTSGPQQVEWDTNMLPDGMYYVSLYVDDELIVKKAVKMSR